MLDTQIDMYSVDTSHFYSNHEKYLHDMNYKYRQERNYLKNKLKLIEKQMSDSEDKTTLANEHAKCTELIAHKREKAMESKQKLLTLLKNKVEQNELSNGKHHFRELTKKLHDTNVISVFESSLTRTIGIPPNTLTDALITVQVYYYDVFKDLAFFGFIFNGEKYKYFTSSAGQIRKKKAVFIKESVWDKIEKTVMCGLTINKINEKGGNNANKHLAYMALTNSATDKWDKFDIDRCIVVDDYESDVHGVYDFIDERDYSITRTDGCIPITHTDGAGMVLPSLLKSNSMIRAPWIKGLLGVFDFAEFIRYNNCPPIVRDIYGNEHDVFKENIQIIFTKSQFKMYKYYDSWDEYKEYFKKYNCQAGLCNIEEERIKNAKINYQMLQSLTDITDDEIESLCNKSVKRITNICTSANTMMDVLGVTPYNTDMTPFQKSLKIYPALLNDTYSKDILREAKNSLLKKYRSGKLEISGKYTFILPDFYAFCEHLFLDIKTPKGLLADGEVFCWLFKHHSKLDCLRSPHLYREHAVRHNIANDEYLNKSDRIRRWFTTNAIYISTYDLISKILQCDFDGDKALVVSDIEFVNIAERNMKNIVPLYYNMRKAEPTILNNKTIYNGLNQAFVYSNIGIYSNNISKIWNSDIFINGTDSEKQEALDCIKLLCMENNFCIDAAKTLYMPKRPEWFNPIVSKFTNKKLPAFFEYAKDKNSDQIENRNNSFVNKIYSYIPNKKINTRTAGIPKLDYKLLMSDIFMKCPKDVSDLYDELNRQYHFKFNSNDKRVNNLHYVACIVRNEFLRFGYSNEILTDMLIEYLYGNDKRNKQMLWFCYGQYILKNLEKNFDIPKTKFTQCVDCGDWFEVDIASRKIRCEDCYKLERARIYKEKYAKRLSLK